MHPTARPCSPYDVGALAVHQPVHWFARKRTSVRLGARPCTTVRRPASRRQKDKASGKKGKSKGRRRRP
ncbi:hypothetical protein HanIR_Chr06g0260591 [Helianthus annuus]|nr:hypothetical protein HanIR_Chr06g0260591 [Helianthus annuus]KAJ0572268.1 hypothetical protein HanHA89_Chr06g0213891 [Helianthus annuus]KAJ0736723.1 hypothetical protein HanLR1_Chr06g0199061 [Helianthus annuus]